MKKFNKTTVARIALIVIAGLSAAIITYIPARNGAESEIRMHPDEVVMAEFAANYYRDGRISHNLYPEGYFCLTAPFFRSNIKSVQKKSVSQASLEYVNPPKDLFKWISEVDSVSIYSPTHVLRQANAALLAICVFIAFITFYALFNNIFTAFVASVAFGVSPLVMEHVHYAETDIACLLGSTLLICPLIYHLKNNSGFWLAISCVFFGAAVAYKTTCAISAFLLIPIGIRYVYISLTEKKDGSFAKKRLVSVLVTCICCILGFAAAFSFYTPRMAFMDFSAIISQVFKTVSAAATETSGIVQSNEDTEKYRYIFNRICNEVSVFGFPALLLMLATTLIYLKNGMRKYLLLFPVFPVLFCIVATFKFGWFRNQELIPVYPSMFIAFAAPLSFAVNDIAKFIKNSCEKPWKLIYIIPLLALSITTLSSVTINGFRTASSFTTSDIRTLAANWLQTSINPDSPLIYERYSLPGFHTTNLLYCGKIAAHATRNPEFYNDKYIYAVHGPESPARSYVDPKTGKIYAKYNSGWTSFTNNSVLLGKFSIPQSAPRITFRNKPHELWYIRNPTNSLNRPIPVPEKDRPTRFYTGGEFYPVFPGFTFLGPAPAIRAEGREAGVLLPLDDSTKFYAVARLVYSNRDKEITWDGYFVPRKQRIAPGHSVWFRLEDNANKRITTDYFNVPKVRMKGNKADSLCLVYVTDDPVYAAWLLNQTGDAGQAEELLAYAGYPALERSLKEWNLPPVQAYNDFNNFRIEKWPCAVSRITSHWSYVLADLPIALPPGKYRFIGCLEANNRYPKLASRIEKVKLSGHGVKTVEIPSIDFEPYHDIRLDIPFEVDSFSEISFECLLINQSQINTKAEISGIEIIPVEQN